MHSFLSKFILLLALALPAGAANIAGSGTGLMGSNDATITDAGSSHAQAGTVANIRDGNLTTRVDNFQASQPNNVNGYVGISWVTARTDVVKSLTLTLATFGDGGWFGNRECPRSGHPLTADMLVPPVVQVSANLTTWTTVPATVDYVSAFTGHNIADNATPTSRAFTITLPLWQTGMRGIRIIGPTGGYGDGNGFLGVFELAVDADAITDSEPDGMDDAWETANGLAVGVNDAGLDNLDTDGLSNLLEFQWQTNPQLADSDGDGLNDGPEHTTHLTFPNAADTDGDSLSDGAEINTHFTSALLRDTDSDGLSDSAEINTHFTLPTNRDTDGDGFSDGAEISLNTDPLNDTSRSANIARAGRAIMGRNTSTSAANLAISGTPRANANSTAHLNDGDLYTRADTSGTTGTASHLGIVWDAEWPQPVKRMEITLATFGDGGWLGNASSAPAPGAALTATHINAAPVIQTTTDGTTWTTLANGTFNTDYVARLTGHTTGGGTRPIATRRAFVVTLNTPASGLRGIRIAGAHYIFLGAYEIAACDTTTATDTDGDGLSDADETTATTSLTYSDTDGDTASDGAEVNTLLSNPLVADSDGDFFPDGMEARSSTNPNDASSNPQNLSLLAGGTIGVKNSTTNIEVATANAGIPGNLTDGEPLTRVDSWNNNTAGTLSWIGARWASPVNVSAVQVQFAIFNHAGWFGPAGSGPAAGGALTAAHLIEPTIQTSFDGGATWDFWPSTSNYMAALTGHLIALADNRPTRPPVVTFTLETPRTGITGIRLIGMEGGVTAPFVGAFEFAAVPGPPTPPDTTWHGVRGDTVTIAVTGDAVPGGGTFDRVEGASGNPVLTDSGEVMFLASVAGAPGSDRAIVRGSGGPLTTVARYAQITPDGTNNHEFFNTPSYNNAGHLLFAGSEGSPAEQAVYRYSPGGNVELLHQSQPIPGGAGDFTGFSLSTAPTTNVAGDFPFHASWGFGNDGLFYTEGTTIHALVLKGQGFDGGVWQSVGYAGRMNDAGTFVFGGSLNYPGLSLRSAYFVRYWEPITGQFEKTRIAREGDAVPEGNGLFGNFSHGLDPRITSAGHFAFVSTLTGTSGGTADNEALYRGRLVAGVGGELVPVADPIARTGQPAPAGTGGGQLASASFLHAFINESGRIAFRASHNGSGASTASAIYTTAGGALKLLVRENMFAPSATGYPDGRFPSLFSEFGFNDQGQISFATLQLRGSPARGIFTTDGEELISIARTGDVMEGSTFTGGATGRRSLNRFGQVAYYCTLADGRNAVRVWTPDLHWRYATGGSWDIGNNWTFGLNPAPMYRLVIGAPGALTVTGPAANTGVKSLQIGGGYGAPVLMLQSNVSLAAAEGVTIQPNGTLAGNGTIASSFICHGTVSPGASAGEITITGPATLTASSTCAVELGGTSTGLLDRVHFISDAAIAGALQVSMVGGYLPPPRQNYIIATVGGTRTGTFDGLAEGAPVGTFGGRILAITYSGGDGNDIALFTGEDPGGGGNPFPPQPTIAPDPSGNGDIHLLFHGLPGQTYLLQRSPDLHDWITLQTIPAPLNGQLPYIDTAPLIPRGYYRSVPE